MSWEIEILRSLGWSDERMALQQMPDRLSNLHRNLPFWHKGQTHCHSNESDGHDGKWGFEGAYQEMGYSFVCLTDHKRPRQTLAEKASSTLTAVRMGTHVDITCAHWVLPDAVHWHHDHVDPHRDENQNGLDDRATRL